MARPCHSADVLIRIVAPYFVAGIVATDGRVATAAPILRYMLGWTGRQVADYCRRKGWQWERVEDARQGPKSPR